MSWTGYEMTIELTQCLVTRPGIGVIYRGPIMAAKGNQAVGVILGPVETQAGDRVAIMAAGRNPQVWDLPKGFTVPGRGLAGPSAVRFDFTLDIAADWSVELSSKMYSSNRISYIAGFSSPLVRVVLP